MKKRKINIRLTDAARPNLVMLFHEYLDRKELEKESYIRDDYPYWLMGDECWPDDMDDMGEQIFPPYAEDDSFYDEDYLAYLRSAFGVRNADKMSGGKRGKKSHKRGDEIYGGTRRGKGKGKRAKSVPMYRDIEFKEDDVNGNIFDFSSMKSFEDNSDKVKIHFYTDYSDKASRGTFESLKEFDDFCADHGFKVSDKIAEELAYGSVSHCCLNPIARSHGRLEIMRADSYADMKYDVIAYANAVNVARNVERNR